MDKRGGIFRFFSSIILGFLPSFLFILMFVQYGSPFSNYLNFLSNVKTSWWAWVAAVVLMLIFYYIFGLFVSRKDSDKKPRKKSVVILVLLLILIIIGLVGSQLFLYTKFLLGSDVLVKLSADNENIIFSTSDMENVTFKIAVTMNPFCTAKCHYEFFDISNGVVIENGDFTLASIFPEYKTYAFNRADTTQSQVINRFEVSCKSPKSRLCYTKGEESKRTILVTVNYDLASTQKQFKSDSRLQILSLWGNLSIISNKLNESRINLNNINGYFYKEDLTKQLDSASLNFWDVNNNFPELAGLWRIRNFQILRAELPFQSNEIHSLFLDVSQLDSEINSNILFYNQLIENITDMRKDIKDYAKTNIDPSSCDDLKGLLESFNKSIDNFTQKQNLPDKKEIVGDISLEVTRFFSNIENSTSSDAGPCDISVSNNNLTAIDIVYANDTFPELVLEESDPICCYYGECETCCEMNESCSQQNYPVIFLHGHSINKALAADYSLDTFADIKSEFADKGYIDAGAMVISSETEQAGLWGRVNKPIEVTASYYFDVYKTEAGDLTVPSKTDSIDTYALRLKDIISIVKHRTNKDKVIVVAHSMGGLVTRKYTEIFGGADIEKVVLIDTPNHGIDDKVKSYCSLLGPESACNDMDKNSIFINKLNNAPAPDFPIYNIVGIGCNMGGETGDGIVKNSSQYLDFATNYYIEGTCNELSFDFLHGDILNPELYPQISSILDEIFFQTPQEIIFAGG